MMATATRSKLVATPRYTANVSTSGSLKSAASGGTGNRKQSSADRSSRDQHRITVMLIIVVVVFLMCQTPQAVQHIYNIYHVVVGVEPTAYQKQVPPLSRHRVAVFLMLSVSVVNLYSTES